MIQSKSTYIALRVDIPRDDPWLEELENTLRWEGAAQNLQRAPLHITVAFIPEKVNRLKVCWAITRVLRRHRAIPITLNEIDSFTAGRNEIINITSHDKNPELYALVNDIRKAIEDMGYHIEHRFRLHVTLARASGDDQTLWFLGKAMRSISRPSYQLKLDDVYFQQFRTRVPLCKWSLGNPLKTLYYMVTLPFKSTCERLRNYMKYSLLPKFMKWITPFMVWLIKKYNL